MGFGKFLGADCENTLNDKTSPLTAGNNNIPSDPFDRQNISMSDRSNTFCPLKRTILLQYDLLQVRLNIYNQDKRCTGAHLGDIRVCEDHQVLAIDVGFEIVRIGIGAFCSGRVDRYEGCHSAIVLSASLGPLLVYPD